MIPPLLNWCLPLILLPSPVIWFTRFKNMNACHMLVEVIYAFCKQGLSVGCYCCPTPKPPKHSKGYYNFICDRKFTLEIGRGCAIQPVSPPVLLTLVPLCNFYSSLLCTMWIFEPSVCNFDISTQFVKFSALVCNFYSHSVQFLLRCVQFSPHTLCSFYSTVCKHMFPLFVSKRRLMTPPPGPGSCPKKCCSIFREFEQKNHSLGNNILL